MAIALVTNDDGIQAAGIHALTRVIEGTGFFDSVVVVAPDQPRSGCSHQTTTDRKILLEEVGDNRYQVGGSPADCVRIAISHLSVNPDWVFAGINHGANLGADVYLSGTTAAAREAAMRGVKSVAFSQYHLSTLQIDWSQTGQWAATLLAQILSESDEFENSLDGEFWNINFPDPVREGSTIPEWKLVGLDKNSLPISYRISGQSDGTTALEYSADYHKRRCDLGLDVQTCFSGDISISRVGL